MISLRITSDPMAWHITHSEQQVVTTTALRAPAYPTLNTTRTLHISSTLRPNLSSHATWVASPRPDISISYRNHPLHPPTHLTHSDNSIEHEPLAHPRPHITHTPQFIHIEPRTSSHTSSNHHARTHTRPRSQTIHISHPKLSHTDHITHPTPPHHAITLKIKLP